LRSLAGVGVGVRPRNAPVEWIDFPHPPRFAP
jgi:hypothetical protein